MDPVELRHQELIARANASLAEARIEAEKDPVRPVYHLMAPANWMNDPNGPIYYKGAYHVFYQLNPYGVASANKSWGHVVSRDLVHWEHLPIALTPSPGTFDKDAIASGCCVVHEGVPTIIYTGFDRSGTGVRIEKQGIAHSYDDMRTWSKYYGNPVIAERPRDDLEGFRDPFAWREDDGWYVVIGSGIKGQGGTALLYRSEDLVDWEYLHPLCVGFGKNWECPNFFRLGDRYVLVVSPHADVMYSVGEYREHGFEPGPWRLMDLGGKDNFYAPNSMEDEKGRRIMWGWVRGGGTEGYPWNGMLTLPRVLNMRPDGLLGMEPAPELQRLRGSHRRFDNFVLSGSSPNVLKDVRGDCLEVVAEFEPVDAESFGIEVRRSLGGEEKTAVGYDAAGKRLVAGDRGGDFAMLPGEKSLQIRLFLDRSVMELYANGRACLTNRVFPERADSLGLKLYTEGGSVYVRSVDVWEMGSIWCF